MNTIDFTKLPEGSIVKGSLHPYDDPDYVYEGGEVLTIKLPNGFIIDMG